MIYRSIIYQSKQLSGYTVESCVRAATLNPRTWATEEFGQQHKTLNPPEIETISLTSRYFFKYFSLSPILTPVVQIARQSAYVTWSTGWQPPVTNYTYLSSDKHLVLSYPSAACVSSFASPKELRMHCCVANIGHLLTWLQRACHNTCTKQLPSVHSNCSCFAYWAQPTYRMWHWQPLPQRWL